MKKLRVGDTVMVISGKDKGKQGTLSFMKDDRVIVDGVNMQTKHVKKTQGQDGGIKKQAGTIHVSNVMLVCPHTGKPTRVSISVNDKGVKTRVSKKAKKPVSDTFTKKTKTK